MAFYNVNIDRQVTVAIGELIYIQFTVHILTK